MTVFHHRQALPGLLRTHGVRHVADLGSGAGDSTALLLESGARVTAVDRCAPVPPDDWPGSANRQDAAHWSALEEKFRRRHPAVMLHKGDAAEAARLLCGGAGGPDAAWLDADLTFRGSERILRAWAEALPDGAVLAGAGCLRTFSRQGREHGWLNVPDAIAAVRRSCPFLSETYTTWQEPSPAWLMFKRRARPSVEILSAATPDVPWWADVQAHQQRYAALHGYGYEGRTMAAPEDRSPVWLKIALMRDRLRQSRAEWLFWLDADAVFWDFARPLHGFVPPSPWEGVFPQFWRGRDCLSTGAFFLRNCDAARELMEAVWDRGHGGGYGSEETLLADVAPGSRGRLLLVDHRAFNSAPAVGIWHGGGRDFVMHALCVPGQRRGVLQDLIARAECLAARSADADWQPGIGQPPRPAPRDAIIVPKPAPLPHGFAA